MSLMRSVGTTSSSRSKRTSSGVRITIPWSADMYSLGLAANASASSSLTKPYNPSSHRTTLASADALNRKPFLFTAVTTLNPPQRNAGSSWPSSHESSHICSLALCSMAAASLS
eukprot:CAMPEP_0114322364 /NCGR_PEP_ID=MMETSP0059-20121206/27187_1 /TAXON_ID=36894 /ORGANISM="Pyramimonas parkeae, Strain CCMP726" /LENGTH=113 /DNA_ID=CAMNT_0001450337 /DNA_START=411 /DNA_END=748 /DNA_ORIENTATION=-